MKGKILKNQKGIAGSDALIAILIIALFVGLIATISYNIYLSNSSVKRMSKATSYIVDMFEYIDKIYYDDVTEENLKKYFNDKYGEEAKVIETEDENVPFKINLEITNYNETEGNDDKLDLVKQIVMKVNYKLGNKPQTIEMKKIKSRETFITPNSPDLAQLSITEGNKKYPIKRVGNIWEVCDVKDNSWYNYETGDWALAMETTEELTAGQEVETETLSEGEKIYAWIPRYAYDTKNNIKFLYSNSDCYIDVKENDDTDVKANYNIMVKINEEEYTKPDCFSENVTGIWTTDKSSDEYTKLNAVYPLNNKLNNN